jgi:hypothetical protein
MTSGRWPIIGALAVLFLAVMASGAVAACRYEWDCSRGYPCRQVPVCTGPLEIPPPQPPGVSPIPPPTIQPIPQPTVPPVGTRSCRPTYLCDNLGRCAWRTVCE